MRTFVGSGFALNNIPSIVGAIAFDKDYLRLFTELGNTLKGCLYIA